MVKTAYFVPIKKKETSFREDVKMITFIIFRYKYIIDGLRS